MADHTWKKKGTTIWQFKCEHKGRTYKQSLRTTDKRIAKAEATRLHLQILEGTYRSPAEIKRAEKFAERKIIESPTVRECYERYVIEKLKDVPDLWNNTRARSKIMNRINTVRSIANTRFYFPKDLKMAQMTHDDLLIFWNKIHKYDIVVEELDRTLENCQRYAKHYKFIDRNEKGTFISKLSYFRTIVNRCKKVWDIDAPDILPSPSSSYLTHSKLNFKTGLRFYELYPNKKPLKPKHLSKEELQHSLKILEKKWPDGFDVLLFQFFTGCRIINALELQWQDIDWDHNIITMVESKGPIGNSYTIPMTPQIISLLQKKRDQRTQNNINNMYVFNYKINKVTKSLRGYKIGDYKPFVKSSIDRKLDKILRKNGVKWTTHQLRHTAAASLLLAGGASLKHVQEQLGHKDIKTTMIYSHLDKSELARKTSQSIDNYLNEETVRNTVPLTKLNFNK